MPRETLAHLDISLPFMNQPASLNLPAVQLAED